MNKELDFTGPLLPESARLGLDINLVLDTVHPEIGIFAEEFIGDSRQKAFEISMELLKQMRRGLGLAEHGMAVAQQELGGLLQKNLGVNGGESNNEAVIKAGAILIPHARERADGVGWMLCSEAFKGEVYSEVVGILQTGLYSSANQEVS